MVKRSDSIVRALLSLMLAISPAWADEYQDTTNIFRNAGQSGSFFSTASRIRRLSDDRKGRRRRRRRVRQGPRLRKREVRRRHIDVATSPLRLPASVVRPAARSSFSRNERSFKANFSGGNFEFGAEASAVAITAAAGREGGYDRFIGGHVSGGKHDAPRRSANTAKAWRRSPCGQRWAGCTRRSIGGQEFSYKPR